MPTATLQEESTEIQILEPNVVYRLIDEREGKARYNFDIGTWARGAGFSYEKLVEALALNSPRQIVTEERETPKFAEGKWRFEKLKDEELGQLERDIKMHRTKTLLKP